MDMREELGHLSGAQARLTPQLPVHRTQPHSAHSKATAYVLGHPWGQTAFPQWDSSVGLSTSPRAERDHRPLGFTQGWEGTETTCAQSSLTEQGLSEAGSGQRVWGACSVRGEKAKGTLWRRDQRPAVCMAARAESSGRPPSRSRGTEKASNGQRLSHTPVTSPCKLLPLVWDMRRLGSHRPGLSPPLPSILTAAQGVLFGSKRRYKN